MESQSVTTPNEGGPQADRVVAALRELLLRGEFLQGQRLTEMGLAARLHASRTPVRQALDELAHQGWLRSLPNGGFAVAEFSVAEVGDAIELRGVLEGTAARLAAERLSHPDELAQLRRYCQQMEEVAVERRESPEFFAYLDLNRAFHAELRRLSKNAVLVRSIEAVIALPFAAPGALLICGQETALTSVLAREHHRAIVESIEHREGTRAESLAREHTRACRQRLLQAVEDHRLRNRVPGVSLISLPRNASVGELSGQ